MLPTAAWKRVHYLHVILLKSTLPWSFVVFHDWWRCCPFTLGLGGILRKVSSLKQELLQAVFKAWLSSQRQRASTDAQVLVVHLRDTPSKWSHLSLETHGIMCHDSVLGIWVIMINFTIITQVSSPSLGPVRCSVRFLNLCHNLSNQSFSRFLEIRLTVACNYSGTNGPALDL